MGLLFRVRRLPDLLPERRPCSESCGGPVRPGLCPPVVSLEKVKRGSAEGPLPSSPRDAHSPTLGARARGLWAGVAFQEGSLCGLRAPSRGVSAHVWHPDHLQTTRATVWEAGGLKGWGLHPSPSSSDLQQQGTCPKGPPPEDGVHGPGWTHAALGVPSCPPARLPAHVCTCSHTRHTALAGCSVPWRGAGVLRSVGWGDRLSRLRVWEQVG